MSAAGRRATVPDDGRRLPKAICDSADIQMVHDGPTATLTLDGTFSRTTRERLGELLDWLIQQGCRDLHIDFGATVGVDWACLHGLRRVRDRLCRLHGRLTVCAQHREVTNELMMTGLTAVQSRHGAEPIAG